MTEQAIRALYRPFLMPFLMVTLECFGECRSWLSIRTEALFPGGQKFFGPFGCSFIHNGFGIPNFLMDLFVEQDMSLTPLVVSDAAIVADVAGYGAIPYPLEGAGTGTVKAPNALARRPHLLGLGLCCSQGC